MRPPTVCCRPLSGLAAEAKIPIQPTITTHSPMEARAMVGVGGPSASQSPISPIHRHGSVKRKRSMTGLDSSPGSGDEDNSMLDPNDKKRQPGVKRACNECRQQKVSQPSCSNCYRLTSRVVSTVLRQRLSLPIRSRTTISGHRYRATSPVCSTCRRKLTRFVMSKSSRCSNLSLLLCCFQSQKNTHELTTRCASSCDAMSYKIRSKAALAATASNSIAR